MENKFDFTKTKEHLKTLTGLEDKIKYLLEVKTEYLQSDMVWELQIVPFDKKCNLELSKLYEIIELQLKIKRIE